MAPSGETIFRYIDTMARHMKPHHHGKEAVSLATIWNALYRMIALLRFRHRDLDYGPTDLLRITTHLKQLVQRRLLFKGNWVRKQWVGIMMLQRLASKWLQSAISDGCQSWDVVLQRLMTVLLQSAVAGRSEEIGMSPGYVNEYMRYEDIELSLSSHRPPTSASLPAKITLKYLKGHK